MFGILSLALSSELLGYHFAIICEVLKYLVIKSIGIGLHPLHISTLVFNWNPVIHLYSFVLMVVVVLFYCPPLEALLGMNLEK